VPQLDSTECPSFGGSERAVLQAALGAATALAADGLEQRPGWLPALAAVTGALDNVLQACRRTGGQTCKDMSLWLKQRSEWHRVDSPAWHLCAGKATRT